MIESTTSQNQAPDLSEIVVQVRNAVGYITLNRPKALNTLNLNMVRIIQSTLKDWLSNDKVKAVVVQGSGDKAFCAGGDVRIVRDYIIQNRTDYDLFFEEEYALNEYIYHYPKPYIAAMHGIVMGGGMGIAQGAGLRLVNEHTRMAMPETAIGFFPDVGASYFLTRHDKALAIYLGMVGKVLSADDALFCRLADWYLPSQHWPSLFSRLEELAMRDIPFKPDWNSLLPELGGRQEIEMCYISQHLKHISDIFSKPSVPEILQELEQCNDSDWAQETLKSLSKNSPFAMHATQRLLSMGAQLNLSECFKLELALVKLWRNFGEFSEGVRSVLIDKDKQARWNYSTQELTPERLARELPILFGPANRTAVS
jgi:enoyl-CoA hydratase/carnithine racemase